MLAFWEWPFLFKMFTNLIAILMLIFICVASHKSTQFYLIFCVAYLSFGGTSVLAKYTLLVVKYCNKNSFEKHQNRCQNQDFSYPNCILVRICNFQAKPGESWQGHSKDDYRTGCGNVSHCQQHQSYSGLGWTGRSNTTYFWNYLQGLNLSQDQNGWTFDTFRFEDENDYEYEIWPKDFFWTPKKASFYYFSLEKLALLS